MENQWDLLKALDMEVPTPSGNPVEMRVDHRAAAEVDARLAAAGVTPDEDLAVLHVSAGPPFRRWPIPSFVETVVALASRAGRRVIVTSGPSDRQAAVGIINEARGRLPTGERHRVLDCGEFSLSELRALIEEKSAALFIGGDSGPLHIAATTRVPIVGLQPDAASAIRAVAQPAAPVESVTGPLPCRPCDQ